MSKVLNPEQKKAFSSALILGALGVVYGDIATSPLYAFQAAFDEHGVKVTPDNVIGLLSITFWALVLVVSCKYIAFIMRADNKGEGGIMSLLALARSVTRTLPRWVYVGVTWLGLGGAAFFFGDSVITPAVSVISAVEGLKLVSSNLEPFVVPISIVVLLGLFFLQRFGSESVGRIFGPVMVAWLLAIGGLGILWTIRHPGVLSAINPWHAWMYFSRNGFRGFETLGAVVLVLTGAEALYADMGHFGAGPIRFAWFSLVLPCLLLNYFGQAALLLISPDAAAQPFYQMVPHLLLYPMIALAALATVIASQAVISGTFSMARSAMLLGFLPRMTVDHTSKEVDGQIYLPGINLLLFAFIFMAVLLFKSSNALAAAYGIAVSGTMSATTVLALLVARRSWQWSYVVLVPLGLVMMTIDAAFFSANMLKIESGGWFPLALGLAMFVVMITWRRGRQLILSRSNATSLSVEDFISSIAAHPPNRVDSIAVFLTAHNLNIPNALLRNLKANQILHQTNIILEVEILEVPKADITQRIEKQFLGDNFHRVTMRFGFAEDTDVPRALLNAGLQSVDFETTHITYFVSQGRIFPTRVSGLMSWRAHLFTFMARNAESATARFHLPENNFIEIGTNIDG